MSETLSRRNFLRGRVAAPGSQLRPPGALPEAAFTEVCSRCGDCARACPTHIIEQGDGGYPTIDFALGECTFCTDCITACQPKALQRTGDSPPWPWRAHIGDACLAKRQVECRICGEQCGENAIRFQPLLGGVSQPLLASDRCTGCGACVAPCPAQAIGVK